MELRHLRYFVAVADEQHVGRAAARLHVSASPLSRQIHELEREVGAPLLERVGRGVRLSRAGATFAAEARAILAAVDRAVRQAQAAQRGEVGHLAIGFVESPAVTPLVPLIAGQFRRRHPGVTLELLPLTGDELRLALGGQRISAALIFLVVDPDPAFPSELLFREPIRLAVPRAHPLARRRSVLIRDLHDQPFVWSPRPDRAPFLDTMWAMLRTHGVTPRVVVESRSSVTRLNLVASGVGMTFVSEAAPRSPQVVVRNVADLKIEARAYLAWRADEARSPLIQSLRDLTRAAVRGRSRL
ncbi:MAG TPA: LysR family transcriptional regulator [Polyangia bacterium]|nr:LysR family transcriptional regulator [Polyangia bacterium]